jgi:hypothetical protein
MRLSQELNNPGALPGQEQAPVMSVKDWMLTLFLCMLPLVNLVLLFVWAFSDNTNPNKRNYARASLILSAIVLGLYLLFAIVFFAVFGAAMNM